MKKTSPSKIVSLVGLALIACSAFAVSACGGETAEGQHDSCEADADCPEGKNLACLTSSNGEDKSCEIKCDPTKVTGACPFEQTCETEAGFGDPICVELGP